MSLVVTLSPEQRACRFTQKARELSVFEPSIRISFMKVFSHSVILADNYIAEVTYPLASPCRGKWSGPTTSKSSKCGQAFNGNGAQADRGQFVPGVSYQIGPDGQPIRTAETAAAEKRAFQAQREIAEETWRTSGLRYADPETGEIVEPEEQP